MTISSDVAELQASYRLPREALVERRLYFHPGTQHCILSFVVYRNGIPLSRLYLRKLSDDAYRPVIDLTDEGYSLVSPIVDEHDFLFFLHFHYYARDLEGGGAGDFRGVVRLELNSGAHEEWTPELPGGERMFVTELVGLEHSGDRTTVYGLAGIMRPADGVVDYHVVGLDWMNRSAKKIGALPGIFF